MTGHDPSSPEESNRLVHSSHPLPISSMPPRTSMTASERERARRVGRRLFAWPTLWQDWDREAATSNARYWELFTDLLLVAAASAVADRLKEAFVLESPSMDANMSSMSGYQQEEQQHEDSPVSLLYRFWEFAALYMGIVNSWLLFTHHYTSRFDDDSLVHSFVLLIFLVGMASSIVHASLDTAVAFSLSIVQQRFAILLMLLPLAIHTPRARPFVTVLGSVTLSTMICFAVAVFRPEWALYVWTVAAIIDNLTETICSFALQGFALVPVNIEHSADRLSVLVLIMLGESVISVTIMGEGESKYAGSAYDVVLISAFVLIFMFTLMFFNMQPPVHESAIRRSRLTGVLLITCHRFIGMTLLMVGVYIKLAVQAVVGDLECAELAGKGEEEIELSIRPFDWLLPTAVGCSMILLYCMRLCHYGGKYPRPHDPLPIQRLQMTWWIAMAILSLAPFCFLRSFIVPTQALAIQSGLLLLLCVTESTFTHILQEFLPKAHGHHEEQQHLQQSTVTSYHTQASEE